MVARCGKIIPGLILSIIIRNVMLMFMSHYVTFNLRLNAEGNLRVRFPKLSDSDTQIAESVLSQDGTLLDQRTLVRIEMNAAGFPKKHIIYGYNILIYIYNYIYMHIYMQNIRELMKIPVLFCVLCAGGFTRTTFTGASCRLRLTWVLHHSRKARAKRAWVEVDESWLPSTPTIHN